MRGHLALAIFAMLSTLPGCLGDSEVDLEVAKLGDLEYAIPAGWTSKDLSEHQTKIIVWAPSDNPRKETVALMRTRDLPTAVKSDFAHLQQFLLDTEKSLPNGRFGSAHRLSTKHGLVGMRVDGEFVPDGTKASYRRIHAVLIDGTALVHILYTARDADAKTFDLVLDSLTKKAG